MALKIFAILILCTLVSSVPDPDVNINININVGNAGSQNTALPKVVIDTDAGVDDAMAILMLLAAHKRGELEVVGITTVNGMTGAGNLTNNVLRILETANLLQIPVYSGSWTPLIRPWSWDLMVSPPPPYNGYNGFCDVPLSPVSGHPQKQPAAAALLKFVKKYKGSLTLVCLGPLSNIAIAMRMDPHFTERLSSLYIMGGNSTEYEDMNDCWNPNDTGLQRNLSLCWDKTEFNFYVDAEAARIVLKNTKTKIHLVPYDYCLENQLAAECRREFGDLGTAEAYLMNNISVCDPAENGNWTTYDQLAAAWVIDDIRNKEKDTKNKTEHLVVASKEYYGLVQLEELCRGTMMIDNRNLLKKPNLIIMEETNIDIYKKYLRNAFGGELEGTLNAKLLIY